MILATDADVDGMHIRNLLLTYFLRFFEELVQHGHVYILETPLFRVRNKKETRYCYSEKERDRAIGADQERRGHALQGPGRDLAERVQAVHRRRDIRLEPGRASRTMSEVAKALEFFMGKNTPERRDFIVDNLITDVV